MKTGIFIIDHETSLFCGIPVFNAVIYTARYKLQYQVKHAISILTPVTL